MSSISTYKDKAGGTLRAIQFVGTDKKRRSIRLGTLPAKDVEAIRDHINLLEAYRRTGRAPDARTAEWLGTIDADIHDKLSAGGLVEARGDSKQAKGLSLGAFLENYMGQRLGLANASKITTDTYRKEMQTRNCLVDKFGTDKLLRSFNAGDAEDFRHYLLTSGSHSVKRCGSAVVIFARRPLAENTTRKHCSTAGKFFRAAVRRELVSRNPFDNPSVPKSTMATNDHAYIKAVDAKAVQDKLPDTQWRLLFALARWGGLRIGETRLLTWGDALWDANKLLVHSPKTAHFHGRDRRLIPIFPELLVLLEKRYQDAAEGEQHILPFMQGRTDASLRKPLEKAITLAGVTPWKRLWHNLRGTRQNELLEAGFPRKAVCDWMGNSSAIADKHYEKLTEVDWQKAIAPDNAPPAEKSHQSR